MKIEWNFFTAAWVLVAMELLLWLIWMASVFGTAVKPAPAERRPLLSAFASSFAYIMAGALLLLFENKVLAIVVIIMASVPVFMVLAGVIKYYFSGKGGA
jgi:hypothetical protein